MLNFEAWDWLLHNWGKYAKMAFALMIAIMVAGLIEFFHKSESYDDAVTSQIDGALQALTVEEAHQRLNTGITRLEQRDLANRDGSDDDIGRYYHRLVQARTQLQEARGGSKTDRYLVLINVRQGLSYIQAPSFIYVHGRGYRLLLETLGSLAFAITIFFVSLYYQEIDEWLLVQRERARTGPSDEGETA